MCLPISSPDHNYLTVVYKDNNHYNFLPIHISNYSWECPKEGGKEIFTSNKEEWEIDQLILDGIIMSAYKFYTSTFSCSVF